MASVPPNHAVPYPPALAEDRQIVEEARGGDVGAGARAADHERFVAIAIGMKDHRIASAAGRAKRAG